MNAQSRFVLSRRDLIHAAGGAVAFWGLARPAQAAVDVNPPRGTPLFPKSRAKVRLVFTGDARTRRRTALAQTILTKACPRIEFDTRFGDEYPASLTAGARELDGFVLWSEGADEQILEAVGRTGKPIVMVQDRAGGPMIRAAGERIVIVGRDNWKDLLHAIWPFAVLKAMKETTILVVPDREIAADAELLRRTFGTRVVRRTGEEIAALYRRITPAEAADWAQAWRKGAGRLSGPPGPGLTNSARLYLALRRALEECRADVVATDCSALKKAEPGIPFCCMSHFQMNNDGAVSVCSADLNLACAQAMATYCGRRPGFLTGAPGEFGREAMRTQNACASRLFGESRPPCRYELQTTEDGAAVYLNAALPPREPLTFISLDLGLRRLTCAPALTGPATGYRDRCRKGFAAGGAEPGRLESLGRGQAVALFGDFSRRMEYLARLAGLRTGPPPVSV